MTWPFENDTSGIVKRISNRSISANRKRNIFIILTIALASALLSAIVLYGFGVMQETQNRNQKTAQIMYHAISEQQGQELYKQEEIAWVGEFFNAFSEQVNHSTVNFTYANADMLKSQSMPYSGDLPASENEIVVQESFLDSLGYSNELGQTIQIPFSDGTTHDFKLTGILDVKTGDIGRYTAIISKELVRQQYGDEGMIDYYIGLKGAQNMSEEEATNYANTLAQQLKISDDNVIVRSTYFNLKDENHGSDMLFYFLIGFVTFIGSGIVIYSIFYISVASSIRNYGQNYKTTDQKDGLPRGEITCCHCYPDWSGYWKCDWVLSGSCRLVLADHFMCDGRGWPFCIYYCDDCHSYSCKKSCGSISAGSIAIFRLSGKNERKFRAAP